MISSYSDPVGTLRFAAAQGYSVDRFLVVPLGFGRYSSEPKVREQIEVLRASRKAFYDERMYLLAGVLFRKHNGTDLSDGLLKVLTAL